MRILDYAIAAVVIPIFFLVIGGLIYVALQCFFTETLPTWLGEQYFRSGHRKYHERGWMCRDQKTCPLGPGPRSPLWERVRAWYYGYQIDRLAADIERKLGRKQRRAEEWQRNHHL